MIKLTRGSVSVAVNREERNLLRPQRKKTEAIMKTMLNRREFLKLGTGALFAAGAGCVSSRANDAKYSVLVLGDVHFDAPEIGVYHAHYKPTTGKAAEIFPLRMKREHDQWSGLMQRLAAAARKDIKPDTKFVLQLGDLIHETAVDFRAVHSVTDAAVDRIREVDRA